MNNLINRIPWQIKLVLLMLLMAVIPALLISYGVVGIIRDELKSNINGQLIYSSNSIASNIDSKLKKNIEILQLSKNIVENQELGSKEKVALLVSSVEKIDNLILLNISIKENDKIIEVINSQKDYIIFVNKEKKLIPQSIKDEVFNQTKFDEVEDIKIFQPFYEKELREWLVAIVIKLSEARFPGGYLTALFSLSDIVIETESNILNKIGNVFVSDTTGAKFLSSQFLFEIPADIINDGRSLLKSKSSVTFVNNYPGTKGGFVSCFSRTQEVDWVVVASIKEEAAYSVVNEAYLFYGLFAAISIVLAIIIALLFSKHLSKPIISMAGISKMIARGNFDARVDYKANDSIGVLNDSLGQMGAQLKRNFSEIENQKKQLEDYSKNLEQKVEERTNELNESNRELKKAYHRVLELNEEKNEFLGIAAHDLKNPLTAVSAFAEIIKTDKELKDEQREDFLDEIMKASQRMFSIVKNLLDVNAIEQGKLNTKPELISAESLITETISQFQEDISRKELTVIKDSKEGLFLLADYNLALQAIQNIFSNAVKFSPSNKKIYISAAKSKENGFVEISIKDEGPGFTEEDKKKLFHKFARLSARPTGGEHSTGLGLSIVKKLVEMMGGSIRLEESDNKGANFIITFPEA